MKFSFFLLLLLPLGFLHAQENKKTWNPPNIDSISASVAGRPFPPFDVVLHSGNRMTTDSIRGKVLLANFWFEHCAPCKAEFKAFNQLFDSLGNDTGFVFIAFTYETPTTIERIVKEYGLRFPIASMSKDEIKRLKIVPLGAIPST